MNRALERRGCTMNKPTWLFTDNLDSYLNSASWWR
jgi:hypothetical protein